MSSAVSQRRPCVPFLPAPFHILLLLSISGRAGLWRQAEEGPVVQAEEQEIEVHGGLGGKQVHKCPQVGLIVTRHSVQSLAHLPGFHICLAQSACSFSSAPSAGLPHSFLRIGA